MGLLLRPDAYYAESPDGVYILTPRGSLSFTGDSVYRLLDRLAPYLDGRYSSAELTGSLPPERKAEVQRLIGALCEHGVVKEAGRSPARDDGEHPAVCDGEYRPEVSFLDSFMDGAEQTSGLSAEQSSGLSAEHSSGLSAEQRFAAYRDMHALIIGAGGQVASLAAAVACSGLRHVLVAATAESPTDLEAVAARTRRARRDREQRFETIRFTDETVQGIADMVGRADVVFHVSSRPMVHRARLIEDLCRDARVMLAQAMPWAGEIWLAVTGPGGVAGRGWTSGHRRLAARHRVDPSVPAVPAAPAAPMAPAVHGDVCAGVVSSMLAHQVFLEATGAMRAMAPQLSRIDPVTLRTGTHTFLPHPFARPPGPVPEPRHHGPAREHALDPEEFSRRAAGCSDDRLGLFGPPAEHGLTQLPLRVCTMEVADPVGLAGRTIDVTGAGLDFAAARHDAALRAFTVHASLMVDPRRLVDQDGSRLIAGDPDRALAFLRAGRVTGHVMAYDIAGEPAGLLEAARVFPTLHRPGTTSPGAAAAYSAVDAVERGLLGQCRRLALAHLADGGDLVPRIPPDAVDLDATGGRYRSIVAALGEDPVFLDVTGRLGVPTVICELGPVAGAASGRTLSAAVRDSMGQAILRYQAWMNDEPAYAPPPVPTVPAQARTDACSRLLETPPLRPADIVTALAERGFRVRVVPLDHDPEAAAVMPYVFVVDVHHD